LKSVSSASFQIYGRRLVRRHKDTAQKVFASGLMVLAEHDHGSWKILLRVKEIRPAANVQPVNN